MAQAMAQHRSATQSGVEKELSRDQRLATDDAGLHLALLGNHPADQPIGRTGAPGRKVNTGGLLEDLRRWRRSEARRSRTRSPRSGRTRNTPVCVALLFGFQYRTMRTAGSDHRETRTSRTAAT